MSTNSANNTTITQEIGQLEGQLASASAEIGKVDAKLALARRSRNSAIFVVLAGVIGLAGNIGHWGLLWAFVLIAGVFAFGAGFVRVRRTEKEHEKQQAAQTQAKAQLADLRPQ